MSEAEARDRQLRADSGPLLSVVILTWNRRPEILRTLDELGRIETRLPMEVIVVDNGSTDGTPDAVASEYPDVELVRLSRNQGTSAWNHGFARARGQWILSLDDDSCPEGNWLDDIPRVFAENPDAGMVACRVLEGEDRRCVTEGWAERTTAFIACGALFRRDVFERAGMYDERVFLYSHEKEYALRVLRAGYDIHYEPTFLVYHRASQLNRSVERYLQFGIEDTIYRIVRYYPLAHIPAALALAFEFHRRWCRRHDDRMGRYWRTVLRAAGRGVRKARHRREPMPRSVRRRLAAIWRNDFAARPAGGRWLARFAPRTFFW